MSTPKKEEKCKCGKPAEPPHPCPFNEEINPEYADELCNCCSDCAHECYMDT